MRSIHLPDHIAQGLDELTLQTGKSNAYHIRRALVAYLEDEADAHIAAERLNSPQERLTLAQVEDLVEDAVAG